MICILSSVKIVQKRQAGCVKKLQRFRNLSRPEYAIENRDAPNCVHGIGFCAKKNDFNFRNFVGNILANMQQFCLLEEGGGGFCKAIEKRITLERLKKIGMGRLKWSKKR